MSSSQRILKNTFFLYVRMGTSIVVNIFTTRILLQALGVSDYGLYNVVAGAIAMLGFVSASMSSATQRYMNYALGKPEEMQINKVFCNSLIIHRKLALYITICLILGGIVFFNGVLNIDESRRFVAICVYGFMVITTVYSITIVPYDAALNAHENMFYYSLFGIVDVLLKLGIAILILYSDFDRLFFYAFLIALESWLLRTFTKKYCERKYQECYPVSIKQFSDPALIKEMFTFAGWNLVNIAAGMISLYGMNIVVNHFYGTHVNAAMGVATQLSGAMMGVSSNMMKALSPILVRTEASQNRKRVLDIAYLGCKFSFVLFAMICIPFLFNMDYILNIWLKVVPEWTIEFCMILIIGTMVNQMFVFLYQAISAEGHIKSYNITVSIVNIIPLLLTFCVFQYFSLDPYWAMINWCLFRLVLGGFVNLYFLIKNLNTRFFEFFKKVMYPCFLLTACLCMANYMIYKIVMLYGISDLLSIVLMLCISLPFIWLLVLTGDERHKLKSIIVSRLH